MIKITETNVTIMVRDMDKSISFYESIGLNLKERWGDHYAMITSTGITIGLHPTGEHFKETTQHISIGFMVGDVKEATALLEKNNIAFKSDDGKSGTYLHFHDPDGSVLYFVQPKWR